MSGMRATIAREEKKVERGKERGAREVEFHSRGALHGSSSVKKAPSLLLLPLLFSCEIFTGRAKRGTIDP